MQRNLRTKGTLDGLGAHSPAVSFAVSAGIVGVITATFFGLIWWAGRR